MTLEELAAADFEVHEANRNGERWEDLPEDRYKEWWRDHAAAVLARVAERSSESDEVKP